MGNPGEFTIKELAEKVVTLTKSTGAIVYKNIPPDDPRRRQPDITLAKEKLGWEPRVKLDEGLRKTIDYFRQTLSP